MQPQQPSYEPQRGFMPGECSRSQGSSSW
jgi:hypothetical protein